MTALSGSETVEQAYALAQARSARARRARAPSCPEQTSAALDAFRAPLSAIRDAELVVVLGDDPVAERAPVVDLWIRAARRNGAEVVTSARRDVQRARRGTRPSSPRATSSASGSASRARDPDLVGPGRRTAARTSPRSRTSSARGKPGSGAFYLPRTPNGRGVADAWAAAGEGEPERPSRSALLIVSGDEAAADPRVRALAERAETRARDRRCSERPCAAGPTSSCPGRATSSATARYVNLEGRLQRLRRAVIPPAPDELAWIAKLAERFGVEVVAVRAAVVAELDGACPAAALRRVGERRRCARAPPAAELRRSARPAQAARASRLVRYRAALLRPRRRARRRAPVPAARAGDRALAATTRSRAAIATGDDGRRSARTARRSSCARASTASSSTGVVARRRGARRASLATGRGRR